MSLSGLEPEPKPYSVQLWWEAVTREHGQMVHRCRMTVLSFHSEAEAAAHLRTSLRGKWVHPDAVAWGCEPVGFRYEQPGERISAAQYVQQVRDGGAGEPVAARAIAGAMTLFREPPDA